MGHHHKLSTAAVLSLIIPGVGQFYNGAFWRGIFWLIITPGLRIVQVASWAGSVTSSRPLPITIMQNARLTAMKYYRPDLGNGKIGFHNHE